VEDHIQTTDPPARSELTPRQIQAQVFAIKKTLVSTSCLFLLRYAPYLLPFRGRVELAIFLFVPIPTPVSKSVILVPVYLVCS